MATRESRLLVRQDSEVTVVGFLDRNILEETSIQQIGEEIGKLVEQTPGIKLLINFENVEHLSSAALGTLITINNKVRQRGGQLRLSNIDTQIYEVFVITKLNKLFQIHENVENAVKSYK
jgi:anti-sigma B factor antagonist